jgi:hypothetical protein
MPTDEIIIRLFLIVDERFGNCKKRSDAAQSFLVLLLPR